MNVDLIIFGCDGVLVDSEPAIAQVMQSQLTDAGIDIADETVRQVCAGRNPHAALTALARLARTPIEDSLRAQLRDRLLERCNADVPVTDGLWQLLERLKVQTCVAASACPDRIGRMFRSSGIGDRFEGRIFTDEQVRRGKPAPDLFLLAARTLGVAPERTLVVEDSSAGMAAGFAAGMQVAFYTGATCISDEQLNDWEDVMVLRHWNDFPVPLLTPSLSPVLH